MNIFLSNDDGIDSRGIRLLAEKLAEKGHNILVVAPSEQRSGYSQALSLSAKLELKEIDNEEKGLIKYYSFSGSPADCVKFGVAHFCEGQNAFIPDLFIGGVNAGSNLGTDVMYSGTVGCVKEATFWGVKSIAISCIAHSNCIFETAVSFLVNNLDKLKSLITKNSFLNINVPNVKIEQIKGVKITSLGLELYEDCYRKIEHDKNIFVLEGKRINHDKNHFDCDVEWIKENYITISPLLMDSTNYEDVKRFKDEEFSL